MAMCQSKRKFGDPETAQAAIARPNVTGKKKPPLFVYQCRVCHCWHLSRRASP